MIEKKSWDDFILTGLLWWINVQLHLFGWAIAYEMDENNKVINVYPARVKFRGFDEKSNSNGYQKLSKYLLNNINDLEKESRE